MNTRTLFEKARDYAFLLLKFRLRSVVELSARLKLKKFDTETIDAVISFLRSKDFLDDDIFAKSWVNSRLKRKLGPRRIREELRQKGLDKEVIERELLRAKSVYPEAQAVADILKLKLKRRSAEDPLKFKRRAYAYLMRRGFSSEIISDKLNNP